MPAPKDIYVKCDNLDEIPPLMRDNYLIENELLSQILPKNSRVLQVGSLDGRRIVSLLKLRPDLQLTGIDIEEDFIGLAKKNVAEAVLNADFIYGDITKPPKLPKFDYVICLNNTLGYIPTKTEALKGMKKLGKNIVVSVYGEKFTDDLARNYFKSIGLAVNMIQDNIFVMEDFTKVKRFTKTNAEKLGNEITETPVGYFCILNGG